MGLTIIIVFKNVSLTLYTCYQYFLLNQVCTKIMLISYNLIFVQILTTATAAILFSSVMYR